MVDIFRSTLWLFLGAIIYRKKIVGPRTPKVLGRSLYWIGMPIQIFFLARKSHFSEIVWLPPLAMVTALLLGLVATWFILRYLSQPKNKKEVGGFVLSSILGNTGFIGLALIPPLINQQYWSWVVLYGIAHNILGSYGLGAFIAGYFSPLVKERCWQQQFKNLLLLPSLWACAVGLMTRELPLPNLVDIAVSHAVLLLIPGAFILIGMELSKLNQWQNLRSGIFPTLVKMLIIPGIIGLVLTSLGIGGDKRLVLVLMSSMPTAFASLILSEAYNLDRNVATSSILLSTLSLPVVLSFWLVIF